MTHQQAPAINRAVICRVVNLVEQGSCGIPSCNAIVGVLNHNQPEQPLDGENRKR